MGRRRPPFSEVQELARGLHPAGLTTQGLRPPIERLAATLPVPLEIEALPERRLPEVLEVTVYYFVASRHQRREVCSGHRRARQRGAARAHRSI